MSRPPLLPPPLPLAFLVWGLGAALYFIGFFQRVTPAVITRELMTEFAIGAAALGNLSAFYVYSYVGMQIPTGLLVDRWGPRRVLTMGAGVAALGTAVFALSTSYAGAGVGRLLIGASVGVAFVAMLKLAAHWFAPTRFAMVSGLALLTGMLGAVGAGAPLRLAADAFGWRPVMLGGCALTALLCLLIWWLVRDDPVEKGYRSHAPLAAAPVAGASVMAGLTALGVQLAVDDFGTGYSSLSYLKRFPVSTVKIDRSFVTGLGQHQADSSLVSAIIAMGSALDLSTIAEGVETVEEAQHLFSLGCRQAQGFLFSKAVSAADVPAVLQRLGLAQSRQLAASRRCTATPHRS